ncbi:MAG: MFS transporter [Pseudomonas sp.]|nr:MFS transporter [Pseudomonas sp.]
MNGTSTAAPGLIEGQAGNDPHAQQTAKSTSKPLNKAVLGVTLGNMVEWFDFALYSSMAVLIGDIFFHSESRTTQLIAIYATFAAGFLMRPLGSLVFGPIGDRYGRRAALTLSIALMAVATFCIALIPSYESIGIAAPILLVAMRMLQGLSTGGEYGGSVIFIAEHAPDKRRSFLTSWLEVGILSGFLLGGVVVSALMLALGEETMRAWGWRVPFVIGGLLGMIALYLRLNLEETPIFKELQENERKQVANKRSLLSMLVDEWPNLVKSMGLVAIYNVCYYVVLGYIPGYLTNELGYSASFGSVLGMVGTLSMLLLVPFSGLLADRVGRKRLIALGCILLIVFSIPAFTMLQTHNVVLVYVAVLGLLVAQLLFEGAMGATLVSLFKAPVRFSALALSYNLSVSLFGGTAPLVNTWLIGQTGNTMIPAYYLIGAAVVGLIAILMTEDRTGKPMP